MDNQQVADKKRVAVDEAMGAAFDALKFYLQKIRDQVDQTDTTTRAIRNTVVDFTIMLNSLDIEDTIENLKRRNLFDSYDRYKQKEVILERRESASYLSGSFDGKSVKRGALSVAKIAGVLALLAIPQLREKASAFLDGFFSQFTEITEDIKKLKKIVIAIGATLAAYWSYKRILDIANALFQVVNLAVVTAAALGFIKLSENDIDIERRRLKVERDKLDKEKSSRNKAREKRRKKAKKVKDALKKARKISRIATLLKISGLGLLVGVAIDASIGVSERMVELADEDEDEDAGDAEIDVTEIIIDEVVKSATFGMLDAEKVRQFARNAVQETNDAEPIVDPEAAMILGAEGIQPEELVVAKPPVTTAPPVVTNTVKKKDPVTLPAAPNIIPADELSDPEAELLKTSSVRDVIKPVAAINKPVAGGVIVSQQTPLQRNNVNVQTGIPAHSSVQNINNNLTNNTTVARSTSSPSEANNVEIIASAPKLNLSYPVEVNVNKTVAAERKVPALTLAQAPAQQVPAMPDIIKTSSPTIEPVPAPKPAPAVVEQKQLVVGDTRAQVQANTSGNKAIRESDVNVLTNAVGSAVEKQNAADTDQQRIEAELAVSTARAALHKNLQGAPAVFAENNAAAEKNNLITYNSMLNASIKRNQSRGMNIINIDNTKVVVYQPSETTRKITREPSIVSTKIGMV